MVNDTMMSISVNIINNPNITVLTNNQDLHVFVPHSITANIFVELYSKRNKYDKEYWLFDISNWTSSVLKEFENLKLDLDDDMYLYQSRSEDIIDIWEMYEIHPSMPRKLLYYGNYTLQDGLNINSLSKWIRRKDLEVNNTLTSLNPLQNFTSQAT